METQKDSTHISFLLKRQTHKYEDMKILLTAIMVFDSIEQYYIYHRSKRLTLKFLLRTVLSLSLTPIANGMLDWAPLPV